MREILFKAKRIDNGEWVEGSYLYCEKATTVSFQNEHYILVFDGYGVVYHEVDRDTLCQYTGLTDKNGKKIWENDIIIVNDRYKGRVIWSEVWTNYMVVGNGHINISIHNRWDDIYEVIGNIFDNPELMKGEEHDT